MFSPTDCFAKNPEVTLRRFPEWQLCYAYTPSHPQVYELNTTAWLILELCQGRSFAHIQTDFLQIVRRLGNPEDMRKQLRIGLRELIDRNIVCRTTGLGLGDDPLNGGNDV